MNINRLTTTPSQSPTHNTPDAVRTPATDNQSAASLSNLQPKKAKANVSLSKKNLNQFHAFSLPPNATQANNSQHSTQHSTQPSKKRPFERISVIDTDRKVSASSKDLGKALKSAAASKFNRKNKDDFSLLTASKDFPPSKDVIEGSDFITIKDAKSLEQLPKGVHIQMGMT